jgi:hypothetical protein
VVDGRNLAVDFESSLPAWRRCSRATAIGLCEIRRLRPDKAIISDHPVQPAAS